MITCVKGGRSRDVVKVCGDGEFLRRYSLLKCYLDRYPMYKNMSSY